jgi:cytoskeletal protein RodZ
VRNFASAIALAWVASLLTLLAFAAQTSSTSKKTPTKSTSAKKSSSVKSSPIKSTSTRSKATTTKKPSTTAKKPSTTSSKKPAPTSIKKPSTTRRKSSHTVSRSRSRSWRSGQQAPTPARYEEIQQALVDRGYLQGPATGKWDAASADALKRFQQDRSLQPTGKLDSLSLIALGLGPKREGTATIGQASTGPAQSAGQAPTGQALSDQPREGPPHDQTREQQ